VLDNKDKHRFSVVIYARGMYAAIR
jgi:hypothetical protein